jgi:hypothetical protein
MSLMALKNQNPLCFGVFRQKTGEIAVLRDKSLISAAAVLQALRATDTNLYKLVFV